MLPTDWVKPERGSQTRASPHSADRQTKIYCESRQSSILGALLRCITARTQSESVYLLNNLASFCTSVQAARYSEIGVERSVG
jgi:hypothetical protein